MRAELGADGWLKAWVDGRPLAPVHVGATAGYLGLATYNLLGACIRVATFEGG